MCCLNLILPITYLTIDFAEATWGKSACWRTHMHKKKYVKSSLHEEIILIKHFPQWRMRASGIFHVHFCFFDGSLWEQLSTLPLEPWVFGSFGFGKYLLWFLYKSLVLVLPEGVDRRKTVWWQSTLFIIFRRQFILMSWITLIKMRQLWH